MDFKPYVRQEIVDLIDRLAFVAGRLADLCVEIAEVEITEHKEKTEAYARSEYSQVTDRRNSANYQALHVTTETIKLKGEKAQLEEEKDFLVGLINWRITLRGSLMEVP